MTSAYILFLNPLILSGAASGTNTGMPRDDVVLATAVSTGNTLTLLYPLALRTVEAPRVSFRTVHANITVILRNSWSYMGHMIWAPNRRSSGSTVPTMAEH